ncbi:lecithin retinol acyltransferase family protein [Clostridium saccharobutylicum]|uniref:NC domain protein n=1 Tax=Clostridium saccharobutylicum TaxID=169679 RepID=A0A1S8NDH4_CLOSA|nr:lecithin retinol acyltransferase family protein [Clostridium saccharobutylicum]OOM14321.1 NC domain protein [Clostridium saccharobutylicum]
MILHQWQISYIIEIYSSDETVKRAKSRRDENSYNLVTNNCEHFAIWCKTGVSKSTQVDNILRFLVPVPEIGL